MSPPGAAASDSPRRADAERNIAIILRTATELLGSQPRVSMSEVAQAAGVGRVTLYGHFPSRQALVDAVVTRAIAEAEVALDEANLDDRSPEAGVRELIATSWQVLDRFNRVRLVAQVEIGERRLRAHHDRAFAHVERLITKGQEAHQFRTDLPMPWLVTAFYALLHAAADQVAAGQVDTDDVPDLLTASILGLLRP